MRLLPVVFLFLSSALALPAGSRCSAKQDGQFWPKDANSDPAEAKAALACGALQICQRVDWRHRWEQVGVPFWQLAGEPAPARCKSYIEAQRERDRARHQERKSDSSRP